MSKKYAIIGAGGSSTTNLAQSLVEQLGEDVIWITPEEAKNQQIKIEDIANLPSYKITAPPILDEPMILGTPPSGQAKRRERRKEERKRKKKI